jgi:hypothetical protein
VHAAGRGDVVLRAERAGRRDHPGASDRPLHAEKGAPAGAEVALLGIRTFISGLDGGLVLLALGVAAAALVVTLISAALPALALRRAPTARLLAGE